MTCLYCSCILIVMAAIFSSCKKFISLPPPPDVLVANQVFTDDAKAVSVVTSIYGNMVNGSIGFSNSLTTV
jgi:starch-binding outer membrane protein, SusD/RagB family